MDEVKIAKNPVADIPVIKDPIVGFWGFCVACVMGIAMAAALIFNLFSDQQSLYLIIPLSSGFVLYHIIVYSIIMIVVVALSFAHLRVAENPNRLVVYLFIVSLVSISIIWFSGLGIFLGSGVAYVVLSKHQMV